MTIPLSIATEIPAQASKIMQQERELIQFCRSGQFSLEGLSERITTAGLDCDLPWRPR